MLLSLTYKDQELFRAFPAFRINVNPYRSTPSHHALAPARLSFSSPTDASLSYHMELSSSPQATVSTLHTS